MPFDCKRNLQKRYISEQRSLKPLIAKLSETFREIDGISIKKEEYFISLKSRIILP